MRLKEIGCIQTRDHFKDGLVGNTLEDYLIVEEHNDQIILKIFLISVNLLIDRFVIENYYLYPMRHPACLPCQLCPGNYSAARTF